VYQRIHERFMRSLSLLVCVLTKGFGGGVDGREFRSLPCLTASNAQIDGLFVSADCFCCFVFLILHATAPIGTGGAAGFLARWLSIIVRVL
jgi:hypothetical protein